MRSHVQSVILSSLCQLLIQLRIIGMGGRIDALFVCGKDRQKFLRRIRKNWGKLQRLSVMVCKETLSVDKFYRDKNSPTGRMRRCKECHKNRLKNIEKKPKIIITEKRCKTCQETKVVSEFHKRMCSRNGYNIYCKVCACQKMTKNKS